MEVQVEAVVYDSCPTSFGVIREEIHDVLMILKISFYKNGLVDISGSNLLQSCCESVSIVDVEGDEGVMNDGSGNVKLNINIFSLFSEPPECVDFICYNADDNEDDHHGADDENAESSSQALVSTTYLPHESLHPLWSSLILPQPLKQTLLSYATTAIFFAQKEVSPHVINWNRMIMLHGPPGNGKTSLCKALANKISIKMIETNSSSSSQHDLKNAILLSVHSHSLVGKKSNGSGKLVSKLLDNIRQLVQDEGETTLFFILLDDVESLATKRSSNVTIDQTSGAELDAVRVVNALLAGLDELQHFTNVLTLTTSNVTSIVDDAFLDRADLKMHIGVPTLEATYEIFKSCIDELIRVGIIFYKHKKGSEKQLATSPLLSFQTLIQLTHGSRNEDANIQSLKLKKCGELATGMSGRTLRKLPFQSHVLYLETRQQVTIHTFLDALMQGIQHEQQSREKLA